MPAHLEDQHEAQPLLESLGLRTEQLLDPFETFRHVIAMHVAQFGHARGFSIVFQITFEKLIIVCPVLDIIAVHLVDYPKRSRRCEHAPVHKQLVCKIGVQKERIKRNERRLARRNRSHRQLSTMHLVCHPSLFVRDWQISQASHDRAARSMATIRLRNLR